MQYKWGIDLGGTKIEGVILDSLDNNKVISRLRLPTEQEHGAQHIVNQIGKVISALEADSNLKATHIGIGTPGVIDPSTKLLKNSNTLCLNDLPLIEKLESHTGLQFKSSNDANCFAVAETLMGAVKDLEEEPEVVFGVIMGTGVGGGLVVNGKIIEGRHGIGGEWGHNLLDPQGSECYCGKKGCVETVISGPALERYYSEHTGVQKSLKEISKLHKEGSDPIATNTINFMVGQFGKGISQIINSIDPDVIILGGGVGNIPALQNKAADAVKPYIFNPIVETKFIRPKLGDSAGVFGAALLW